MRPASPARGVSSMGHAALRVRGLEELDLAVAGREQRRAHALVRDLSLAQKRQPERIPPEAIRPREALDHDADVVDLLDHGHESPASAVGGLRLSNDVTP